MSSLERRIERAEETLSMGEGPIVCNVVWFGGEPVPADDRRDNVIVHYVAYDGGRAQTEERAGHGH